MTQRGENSKDHLRHECVGIRNQIREQIMYGTIVVAVDRGKPSMRALNEAIHVASVLVVRDLEGNG